MRIKRTWNLKVLLILVTLPTLLSCAKPTVTAASDQATREDDLKLRKDASSQLAPVVDKDDTSPQSTTKTNAISSTSSTSTSKSITSHSSIITSTYTSTHQGTVIDIPPPNPTPKLPGAFGLTNLALANPNSSVSVSWSASSGAKSYAVLRGTSIVALSQIASNLTSTSYVDNGPLAPSTTYFYLVSATNDDGTTQANTPLYITVPSSTQRIPPGAFSLISAHPILGQVTLNWVGSSNADDYSILRGTSANSLTPITSGITGTSYIDSTVSNGTTYYYSVKAYNTIGNTPSSNTLSAAVPLPGITTPPGAFAMLNATYASSGVAVNWGTAANASSYSLLRGISPSAMAVIIGNLTTTSYTDPTALPSTTYYYSVTATNANGNTAANTSISITTPSTAAPGPFTITSTIQGTKKVILTWSASNSATSYSVRRGTSPDTYTSTLASGTFLTYTDTTCQVGTTYYYMITAVNAQGATTNATSSATAAPLWGTQQLDAGTSADRKGTAIAIDKTNSNIFVSSNNGDVNKYDKYANYAWSAILGAPRISSLVVDSYSNLFAAGTTISPIGDGITSLVGTSDIFVTKIDANGTKLWTAESGLMAQSAGVYGMSADNTGNLYVIANTGDGGKIYDNDDFATTPLNNMNYVDYAWFRFDKSITNSAYTKTSATKFNPGPRITGLFSYAYGISSDLSGNSYITGWTNRSNISSASATALTGRKDAFIIKLNGFGDQVWTKQFGTSGIENKGTAVVFDSSNSSTNSAVYATGTTSGSFDGNSKTGLIDGFLVRYANDSSGTKQWSLQFGIAGAYVRTTGITVDSNSKVYVSGYTDGTFPGNTKKGIVDFFVAKYDPSTSPGTLVWVKQFGVTNTTMKATDIASVFNSGVDSTYVVGETGGGMDENPFLSRIGLFLIKMDISGNKK